MRNGERLGEAALFSRPPVTAQGGTPRSEPFQQGPFRGHQVDPVGTILSTFHGLRQHTEASCPEPACPGHAKTRSPELEITLALPQMAIAWDVFCWIGHRRFSRHMAVSSIQSELWDD